MRSDGQRARCEDSHATAVEDALANRRAAVLEDDGAGGCAAGTGERGGEDHAIAERGGAGGCRQAGGSRRRTHRLREAVRGVAREAGVAAVKRRDRVRARREAGNRERRYAAGIEGCLANGGGAVVEDDGAGRRTAGAGERGRGGDAGAEVGGGGRGGQGGGHR